MFSLKMKKSAGVFIAFAMMLTALLGGFQTTASAMDGMAEITVNDAECITTDTTVITGTFTEPDIVEPSYNVKVMQQQDEDPQLDHVANGTCNVEDGTWTATVGEGVEGGGHLEEGELSVYLFGDVHQDGPIASVTTTVCCDMCGMEGMCTCVEDCACDICGDMGDMDCMCNCEMCASGECDMSSGMCECEMCKIELNAVEVGAHSTMVFGTAMPCSVVEVTVKNAHDVVVETIVADVDETGHWMAELSQPLVVGDVVHVEATMDMGDMGDMGDMCDMNGDGMCDMGGMSDMCDMNGDGMCDMGDMGDMCDMNGDGMCDMGDMGDMGDMECMKPQTDEFIVKATTLAVNAVTTGDTAVTGTYSNAPSHEFCINLFVNGEHVSTLEINPMHMTMPMDNTSEGDASGTWSIDTKDDGTPLVLAEGDVISATVTDAAGNDYAQAQFDDVTVLPAATTAPPAETPPPTGTTSTNPETFGTGVAIFAVTSTLAGAGFVALKKRK